MKEELIPYYTIKEFNKVLYKVCKKFRKKYKNYFPVNYSELNFNKKYTLHHVIANIKHLIGIINFITAANNDAILKSAKGKI